MATPEYAITTQAYTKIIYHCFKYPYAQVNGILLGKTADSGQFLISDAVALFHSSSLAPMLEIAMMQVHEKVHTH